VKVLIVVRQVLRTAQDDKWNLIGARKTTPAKNSGKPIFGIPSLKEGGELFLKKTATH
jgi:hypothetical protein